MSEPRITASEFKAMSEGVAKVIDALCPKSTPSWQAAHSPKVWNRVEQILDAYEQEFGRVGTRELRASYTPEGEPDD